ncbi:hypothetical protein B5M42_021805 [Paenibacillus athensensis]|uniref:Uncharacterized protein n=1 Tax=Paenibacillus athensensis TaxID=1967502 RepID=A0A4Y8PWC3_9BACL|nr:DUF6583 family protein [Paenibacillus athensensis]MCD1261441.1 hypothetical protein [Paenibacillus athensensis]
MAMNEQDFGGAPQRSRGKLIGLIAGIVGLLVVVLGGGLVAYAQFDVFKSSKLIYLQSELHNLKDTEASLQSGVQTYKKELDPWLNRPVHTTAELSDFTMGLSADSGNTSKVKQILDILQKSKLSLDWQSDSSAKQQYGKLNLNLGGEAPIEIEAGLDKDKAIVRVPLVSDKYMYMDVNNSEELKKLLHSDRVPKKLLTYQDVLNAVSISQEELHTALEPYARLYAESIRDEQVSVKEGVMQEGDISVSGRAVTVTFTAEELNKLDAALIDKLAADQSLQDLVYARVSKLVTLLNDSGYPIDEMSKAQFAEAWKSKLADAKKELADSPLKAGGTMTIYINRKHEILAREWKMTGEEQQELTIKTASWSDKDKQPGTLFVFTTNDKEEGTVQFKLVDVRTTGNSGHKGTASFSFKDAPGSKAEEGSFSLDYDTKTSEAKDSGVYKFKLNSTGDEAVTLDSTVTTETTKSDTLQDTLISVLLSAKSAKEDTELKDVGFKLRFKQESATAIQLPTLSDSNAINLATMSQEQNNQLAMSASMGVYKFMMDHSQLLQDLGLKSAPEADTPAMGHADDYGMDEDYSLDDYSLDGMDSGLGDMDSGQVESQLEDTLRQLTPEQRKAMQKALEEALLSGGQE